MLFLHHILQSFNSSIRFLIARVLDESGLQLQVGDVDGPSVHELARPELHPLSGDPPLRPSVALQLKPAVTVLQVELLAALVEDGLDQRRQRLARSVLPDEGGVIDGRQRRKVVDVHARDTVLAEHVQLVEGRVLHAEVVGTLHRDKCHLGRAHPCEEELLVGTLAVEEQVALAAYVVGTLGKELHEIGTQRAALHEAHGTRDA